MSNIPKITSPDQVWITPTWKVQDEVARAVAEHIEATNDIFEMYLMRQRPSRGQLARSHQAVNRLYDIIKSIPTNIVMTGDPPIS